MAELQHTELSWVIRLQQCCSPMAHEKVLYFAAAQAAAKEEQDPVEEHCCSLMSHWDEEVK